MKSNVLSNKWHSSVHSGMEFAMGRLSVLLCMLLVTTVAGWAANTLPDTPQQVVSVETVTNVNGNISAENLAKLVDGSNNVDQVPLLVNGVYQSFIVDLGEQYPITTINFDWEGATAKVYKVYLSSDNSNWDEVIYETNNTAIGGTNHVNKGYDVYQTGRYVKVVPIQAGNTEWGCKLNEVTVNAYPKSTTNEVNSLCIYSKSNTASVDSAIDFFYYALDASGYVVMNPGESYVVTVKDPKDNITTITGQHSYTFTKTGTYYFTYAGPKGLNDTFTVTVPKTSQKLALSEDMVWVEEGTYYAGVSNAFQENGTWTMHGNENVINDQGVFDTGFVIDLKGYYEISSIHEWYNDDGMRPAEYTIALSEDGAIFTEICSVSTVRGDGKTNNTYVNGTDFNYAGNARYVKFHSTKATWTYGVKIKEFDITAAKVKSAVNDGLGPVISSESVVAGKTTADITVTATDESGEYVYYKLEQVDPAGEPTIIDRFTSMRSGEAATFTLTGLDTETSYTYHITAYDAFGNSTTLEDLTFATRGTSIKTIQGTVATNDPNKKDIAEETYAKGTAKTDVPVFTVLDEDGNTIDKNDSRLKIHYVVISNPQGIINTTGLAGEETMGGLPYSESGAFTLDQSKIGTAIIRIYGIYTDKAENVSYSDQRGYYGINVFGDDLTVSSFKIGETEYTKNNDASYDGKSGDLKTIINSIAGAGAYLNVTELHIDGTLNTEDLRTLRAMGGITNAEITSAGGNPYIENGDRAKINNYRGKDPHHVDGDKLENGYSYQNQNGDDPTEMYTTEGKCYNETGTTYGSLKVLDLSNASFKTMGQASDTEAQAWYEANRYGKRPDYTYTWADLIAAESENTEGFDAEQMKVHNQKLAYLGEARAYKDIIVTMDGDGTQSNYYSWNNTGGLYNINHFVFMGCINLEEVTLPDYCGAVGEYAFQYCENLKMVNNIDKPEIFGMMAFGHCANLEQVTFNSAVKQIGYSAFQNCKVMQLTNTVLPNTLNDIGTYAFAGCDGLTEITWPRPVNNDLPILNIKTGVFMNCRGLTTFNAPKELITVGYQTFQGSFNLADFNFYDGTKDTPASDNNLKNIIGWAFDKCWALKAEDINQFKHVRLIGSTAFRDCRLLNDENLETLLANFQDGSDEWANGSVVETQNDHFLNNSTFAGCIAITKAEIPASVIGIGVETFSGCTALKFVDLKGENVQSIGRGAFLNDTKLRRFRVHNTESAPKCYMEYWMSQPETVDGHTEWVYRYRAGNPFANIDPNHVTLEFGDDGTAFLADYRTNDADYHEGSEDATATAKRGNAWMYLLTKTMNENGNKTTTANGKTSGTYEVVEQEHADVRMTRTLNATAEGSSRWNSFILPFGLSADEVKTYFGDDAYLAQFGWYANEGDATPTYVRDNVLQFQKTDAIVAGTPYLLKVSTGGTAYEFKDVNIGHYKDIDEVENIAPVAGNWSPVTGEDFTFTGADGDDKFANVVGINKTQNVLYITGTPSVFKYKTKDANSTLNVKAFRSFFTYPDEMQAKVANLGMLDVYVDDNVVTAIDDIELETGDATLRGDIYSLGGQLIRRNATIEGLKRGVYIVNGKKYVVK